MRPPLSRREHMILVLLTAYLVIATWPVGGQFFWAQLSCALVAAAAFALLFVPMGGRGPVVPAAENGGRLIRFPVFWIGLGLLAYVLIQNLNPAYAFTGTGRQWALAPLEHITWLPSGMDLPARRMNGWRFLLVIGALWFVMCTLWVGLRRRKAMRIFLWVFVINLFLWGAVTVMQLMTDAPGILWFYETPAVIEIIRDPATGELLRRTQFYGLMINPNHAAALLNIGLVAAGALFLYYLQWAQRTFARGGPHLILIAMAAVMLAGAVLAVSRAGILVAIALTILLLICLAVSLARHWREMGNPLPAVLLFGGLLAVVSGLAWGFDWEHLDRRIQQTQRLIENPASEMRFYLNKGTLRMIGDRPVFGWGAASFRYRIPYYRDEIPELLVYAWQPYWDEEAGRVRHERYPAAITHAHNDYLQCAAELGLAGCGLIALMLLWGTAAIIRNRRSVSIPWIFLFTGLLFVAAHALVDFIFYIPGILAAWVLLAVAGLKWVELSRQIRIRPERVTHPPAGGRLLRPPP